VNLGLEHIELHGDTPVALLLIRNTPIIAEARRHVATPQYAQQALEFQELRTKKTLAAFPREGSQSE
jgi:hypothetical protein